MENIEQVFGEEQQNVSDPELDAEAFTVDNLTAKTRAQWEEEQQALANEAEAKYSEKQQQLHQESNLKRLAKEDELLLKQHQKEVQELKKEQALKSDEKQKKELFRKIKKYCELYPDLAEFAEGINDRSNIAALQESLESMRETNNNRASLGNLIKKVEIGAEIMESVIQDGKWMTGIPQRLRLNLTGLSKGVKSGLFNDSILPILTELDVEYPFLGGAGLFTRSMGAIVTILLTTHVINTNPNFAKIKAMENQAPLDVNTETP